MSSKQNLSSFTNLPYVKFTMEKSDTDKEHEPMRLRKSTPISIYKTSHVPYDNLTKMLQMSKSPFTAELNLKKHMSR